MLSNPMLRLLLAAVAVFVCHWSAYLTVERADVVELLWAHAVKISAAKTMLKRDMAGKRTVSKVKSFKINVRKKTSSAWLCYR